MTVISASDARANFQEIINRVEYGGERILIQRHGKTAVAVIGLEDLKRLQALEDAILMSFVVQLRRMMVLRL
jgi:prevent-host-death family protein